jgi:hypothetical protein
MMEAILVLSAALQTFWLEPVPGSPFPRADPRITLRPASVEINLIPKL